ncbi:MAG: Uma2 family endonuclease [Phormidesmis sp.]
MNAVKTPILTDSWISMDWDTFVSQSEDPALAKAKGYYYQGHGRFEMLPVGRGHAGDHVMVSNAINLFCILKAIPIRMFDNCSYHKTGQNECQPDLSAYLYAKAKAVAATGGIVDLDKSSAPDLAIEIANTSLLDDLGSKRSLYEELGEELGICEYWVVDVKKAKVTAFEMLDQGSQRIKTSQVLPNFEISVLEEALEQSREADQSQVGAWLLQQFQP